MTTEKERRDREYRLETPENSSFIKYMVRMSSPNAHTSWGLGPTPYPFTQHGRHKESISSEYELWLFATPNRMAPSVVDVVGLKSFFLVKFVALVIDNFQELFLD